MTNRERILLEMKQSCLRQLEYFEQMSNSELLKSADKRECGIRVTLQGVINACWYEYVQKHRSPEHLGKWLDEDEQ